MRLRKYIRCAVCQRYVMRRRRLFQYHLVNLDGSLHECATDWNQYEKAVPLAGERRGVGFPEE